MQKTRVCLLILLSLCVFLPSNLYAQPEGGVRILPSQGKLYEDVKKLKNPYILPFMGKEAGEHGFVLPFPIGIMLNGYVGDMDVNVSNLNVGLSDAAGNQIISQIPLDEVVGFSNVSASVKTYNMRTDLWVLPFLDVYGIFGNAFVETGVGINQVMNNSVNINTQANFKGYVYGMGAMLIGGVQNYFFSMDVNKVWSHLEGIKDDNAALNVAPRVGYVIRTFDSPEKNVSFWTGVSGMYLSSTTDGSIGLSEIAPDFIDNSAWYDDLSPAAQHIIDRAVENHAGDKVDYSLDKRPERNWAMVLGGQYQINRHWQFRAEANFLGHRKSGFVSANYRFGIFD